MKKNKNKKHIHHTEEIYAKFRHHLCLKETVYGTENMDIWLIVLQIVYDSLDICEIDDEICHICTLHWGYPHGVSDFPRSSVC